MIAILLELQNTEGVPAEHHGSGNFKYDPRLFMGSLLTCDGFFREPVSGRLRLWARPAEVVIGGEVLLDGVTWPWVVTGPPGVKAGGLGREKKRVIYFLRLGRSFEVLVDL